MRAAGSIDCRYDSKAVQVDVQQADTRIDETSKNRGARRKQNREGQRQHSEYSAEFSSSRIRLRLQGLRGKGKDRRSQKFVSHQKIDLH